MISYFYLFLFRKSYRHFKQELKLERDFIYISFADFYGWIESIIRESHSNKNTTQQVFQ